MSSPYESRFYNVTTLSDLSDKPRVFRAAGATVVLSRDGDRVTAIDGSGTPLAVRVDGEKVWVCLEECKP